MTNKRDINQKLMKKAEKIRKEMADRGESYNASDEELGDGPILEPRNDIEYQKLKNEIRGLDDE